MPAAKGSTSSSATPDSSAFHVAIVGGGIGGLSVALSLATYCPTLAKHNITVYEQAPAYTEIGAGISIGVSAGRVLQKLGVYEAVNAISGHRTNVHRSNRRWDTDELIVDASAANSGGEQEDVRQLWLHRAEFLEVLYTEVQRRHCAALETNKRVVSLEDGGSTVTLSFADGTEATANLVIGCDGIHSAVRSQFVVDKPVYSGRIAFRGIIPMSAVADNWPYSSWTMSWLAPNKHFLAFGISQNRSMNVVAFVAKPESELHGLKESWRNEAPREAIEQEYAGWCPMVQRIIAAMPPVISEWKINDREVLSQWVYMGGKVVLSGDAAHAMLPMQGSYSFTSGVRHYRADTRFLGSGAGLSIEDANILGFAVRDYLSQPSPGLARYMLQYQQARVHRAQKAQVTSRQAAAVYDMQGPDFEGKTFDECLPVVRNKVKSRMAWLWKSDLEADWEAAREIMEMPCS